ncbi:MAG: hypothetical protein M3N68_06585 [Actinomycetota bacterium]|nr:hypothetical protein [Actinomycetota bacterium]
MIDSMMARTNIRQDALMAQLPVGSGAKCLRDGRLVRLAGWLAIEASVALLAVVVIRDVGLNAVNGWTISLGATGGVVAVRRSNPIWVLVAWFLIFIAMLPAAFGGLGLLYIPSLALLLVGGRGANINDEHHT